MVFGVFLDVVALEMRGRVTALDLAAPVALFDGDLEGFGDVARPGDDRPDVFGVVEHELQQAVGEHLSGVADGDGADTGDLADLAGFDLAGEEG